MDSKIDLIARTLEDYRKQILWDVLMNIPGLHVENYGDPNNSYIRCWWECCSDAKYMVNYSPAVGITAEDIQQILKMLVVGTKNNPSHNEKP